MSSITVEQDVSANAFLKKVGAELYKSEAAHSLILGACERFAIEKITGGSFLRISGSTAAPMAAMLVPQKNLVLTNLSPEAARCLATRLFELRQNVPGVVGPEKPVELFSSEWCRLSGKSPKLGMEQTIYSLKKVRWPDPIAGEFRAAIPGEAAMLGKWLSAFIRESLPSNEWMSLADSVDYAKKLIQQKFSYFWSVNGKPVATAQLTRPTRNGVSLMGVYTPPKLRGRGFASAISAHLSQWALDKGKRYCFLYADRANLAANRVYQKIGYSAVAESKYIVFE